MSPLRFAMIGAGFWARYQLAAWQELSDAKCVAIYDRDRTKALELADQFGVAEVPLDENGLLQLLGVDFVDIVTDVHSHAHLVSTFIRQGIPVICQKPLAPTLSLASELVAEAMARKVPLLVHENWRWQSPIRRLSAIMESGQLGTVIRSRIDYANSFPVFDNQPALKSLPQFILSDIGTHILDTARYLFGEASELQCLTRRIRQDIMGEDVATVLMRMRNDSIVVCNMSYASCCESDLFPQTFVSVEGTQAGVSLGANYELRIYNKKNVTIEHVEIPKYEWVNPAYELVHASIVECHRNLLSSLNGSAVAETTGQDNLRTLQLVHSAYRSAEERRTIEIV